MKRFIYLDNDTLNSYISQINDGLISERETEQQDRKSRNKRRGFSNGIKAKAGITLFGKGIEADASTNSDKVIESNKDHLIKNVQTQIMHDNIFDQVLDYLNNNNLLNGTEIGQFVSVKNDFYIFDIDFYKKLVRENGFLDMLTDIQVEEADKKVEEEYQELNRNNRRAKDIKNIVQSTKDDNRESIKSQRETIEKLVTMMAEIIPYSQILCIENYAVVLNEKYLRDDIKTASFKYGGEIKVLGYITNSISAQAYSKFSEFAGVKDAINTLLNIFFSEAEQTYILHPIAIYYEN